MKLTKRLIPAIAMLMVSAVLMSTASFAWFSMNKDVKVSGLTVNATSDAVFLQIKEAASSTWGIEVTTSVAMELLPVAIKDGVTISKDNVYDATSWYYEYSDDISVSTGNGTEEDIDQSDLGNYVQKLTYNVKNIGDTAATKIHISALTIGGNMGIKMIFVCGEEVIKVDESTAGSDDLVLASALAKNGEITVDVYIYIDGNNENIISNNYSAGSLAGKTIAFTISAT